MIINIKLAIREFKFFGVHISKRGPLFHHNPENKMSRLHHVNVLLIVTNEKLAKLHPLYHFKLQTNESYP